MPKILVLYYSSYGHIEEMAGAVAAGARSVAGAKVGASYALEEGVANLTVFKAPLRAMVKAKRQQRLQLA